jgi:hypothetical protein
MVASQFLSQRRNQSRCEAMWLAAELVVRSTVTAWGSPRKSVVFREIKHLVAVNFADLKVIHHP